ncbi:MAG: DUF2934 domain-containing protein [Bryobacteraceae bacterium]
MNPKKEYKQMNYDQLQRRRLERLAYRLWLDRGSPMGSPDEDWLRAEDELRRERVGELLVGCFRMGPVTH